MKEELFKEKSRYITGFVLIIVAGLILYADNLLLFWAVLGGIYAVGFFEALRLFQVKASFS
ncbi:phosphatidate cytidylyltransferase, partial [Helicobacter pylori]|nr:phosphatidate cytidylyltransferase [Helicobacter pylori]